MKTCETKMLKELLEITESFLSDQELLILTNSNIEEASKAADERTESLGKEEDSNGEEIMNFYNNLIQEKEVGTTLRLEN